MSKLKLKLEILLTIACVGMIIALTNNYMNSAEAGVGITVSSYADPIEAFKAMPREPITQVAISEGAYTVAENTSNTQALSSMARNEADRMLVSGNTSTYKEQVQNDGMLARIMGF